MAAPTSLVTAPTQLATGTTPARVAVGTTDVFASWLDQLGQPIAAPTIATPTIATSAPANAVTDQSARITSLAVPPPPATTPAQTAMALAPLVSKTPEVVKKSEIKKIKSGDTITNDVQPPPPAISLPSIAVSPSPTLDVSATGTAPVPPALSSTSAEESVRSTSFPLAELPTASRLTDQAAVAIQAGLSVDDDHQEPDPATKPNNRPPQAAAPSIEPGLTPPVIPTSAASLPLSVVVPPSTAARATAARSSAAEPSRPPEPATSSLPTHAFNPVDIQQQPLPAPSQIAPTASVISAAAPDALTRSPQVPDPLPSPATQVAHVIVDPVKVVLTSPAHAGTDAPHVTTIQITPVELGRVEVRIERTDDGFAKIQLIAERPETLSRLVHDQSQLQQALDHAGLQQSGRTIEFSLAPPTADASSYASNPSGNDASGQNSPGSGFQRHNPTYHKQDFTDPNGSSAVPIRSLTVRTGIDITA